jgi:hypothetical protein
MSSSNVARRDSLAVRSLNQAETRASGVGGWQFDRATTPKTGLVMFLARTRAGFTRGLGLAAWKKERG